MFIPVPTHWQTTVNKHTYTHKHPAILSICLHPWVTWWRCSERGTKVVNITVTDLLSAGCYLSLISSTQTRKAFHCGNTLTWRTAAYIYKKVLIYTQTITKIHNLRQRSLKIWRLFRAGLKPMFSLNNTPPWAVPYDYSQDYHPKGLLCCWLTVQHHTSGGRRCPESPAVAPQSWRRAPQTSQAGGETSDAVNECWLIETLGFYIYILRFWFGWLPRMGRLYTDLLFNTIQKTNHIKHKNGNAKAVWTVSTQ